MRHLGVLDAEVTRYSVDGGIDVTSEAYLAQVKNIAGYVPVIEVRAFYGVVVAEKKSGLLFTSGVVTSEGRAFADRVGIAILRYNAEEGTIAGLNPLGEQVVEHGIPSVFAMPQAADERD
jgi:hypothetical protein